MRRILSILFWSVIAAAFLGPGTVTTAATAGARHGTSLLWALAFSTLACLVLQEAAARLTIVSGYDLGQAIRRRYAAGPKGVVAVGIVLGAIVLGCAAYQAGNILGGVAGIRLVVDLPPATLTLLAGTLAGGLLWAGSTRVVSRILGGVVAIMGVAFLVSAVRLRPDPVALVTGCVLPRVPEDASLLVLGLVGTTVVPYNLFLGSGIARGQSLADLRLGLAVAILLGGAISMGVLITGTSVTDPFTFAGLADALRTRLGDWAGRWFAIGLAAAGLSSAITAPLAAAVTARSLFGAVSTRPAGSPGPWTTRSWRYRLVWIAVLATGVAFGVADVRPIPAILLAQALNGILLPLVAVFLLLVVNDVMIVGRDGRNGMVSNLVLGAVVATTVLLGTEHVLRAASSVMRLDPPGTITTLVVAGAAIVALAVPVLRELRGDRSSADAPR